MNDEDEDDLTARIRALDAQGRHALLGDLEAIRAVLAERDRGTDASDGENAGESAERQRTPAAVDERSIPVLREVVAPEGAADDAGSEAPDRAQRDLFDPRAFADRLLDDSWRVRREAILAEARRGADALRAAPDAPTDEALKARLAEVLDERVELLLGEALDELRATLGRVVRSEVQRVLDEAFEAAADESTKPDGTD